MRIAVISDIHSNLHALEAVLTDIDTEAPDEIWCLGDVVGYGPKPNECADIVRKRAAVVLVGNHDLAAIGKLDTSDFGPLASESAHWTERELGEEQAAWLRTLEPAATRAGLELYHGSARDPVWEYVLSEEVALENLEVYERADRARRAQPPGAGALVGRRAAGRRARARRQRARHLGRALADQSRVGGPAEGQRRARRLAPD